MTGVNSSANVPYVAQGFVNRTSQDTSAPGGVGGNEWTIDGATNNGSDRRLASSPNSDMIEEVTDFGRVTANANTEPRFLTLMSKLTF